MFTPYEWHGNAFDAVVRRYQKNQLPHAILFAGSKGVGKEAVANALAAYILCENKTNEGAACGECKQCRLIKAESHADLKVIVPEEEGKQIKVDAIRSVSEFVSQSSQQGGYKVVLLHPAESLNVNAANALLKTLEEPTPNTLIVLVSHSHGQLLPTIKSRCQIVDLPMPSIDVSKRWLESNYGLLDIEAESLLELSGGAPLLANRYAEEGALDEINQMVGELAAVLKRQKSHSEVAERWAGEGATNRLVWTVSWVKHIISLKSGVNILFKSSEAQKIFQYLAGKAAHEQLFALYDLSVKELRLFNGSSNPNKVLSFELLLGRWIELMSGSS